MKRIFYAIAVILALGFAVSCEDTPKNPGDFSKKCTLEVTGPVVSLMTGKTYDLKVARETDTVYKYLYVLKDTTFNEDGTPVIGPDGKPYVTDDSVYIFSKIKAKLIEMEPLYLPGPADTFNLDIRSNARWRADAPLVKSDQTPWYFNYGSTTTGGGDSHLQFYTKRNRSNVRNFHVVQQIITSDSTIMYRIPVFQYGEKDQPADY